MLHKISLIIAFLACSALTSWGAQQVVVMDAVHGTISVDNATASGGCSFIFADVHIMCARE